MRVKRTLLAGNYYYWNNTTPTCSTRHSLIATGIAIRTLHDYMTTIFNISSRATLFTWMKHPDDYCYSMDRRCRQKVWHRENLIICNCHTVCTQHYRLVKFRYVLLQFRGQRVWMVKFSLNNWHSRRCRIESK